MSDDKKMTSRGMLPKIEILLILAFTLIFIIWAASKCSRQSREMERIEALNNPDTVATADTVSPEEQVPSSMKPKTPPAQAAEIPAGENASRLYVTIDGLNMRRGPHLDSAVVLQLSLYDEVYFLNEYTEFIDTISLGYVEAAEPWFKVRHPRGKEGWVFGAGVDFYKYKREGVLE